MTFVTVSTDREQLTLMSQYLVILFPGCTIHQSCDPMRAIQRVSCQKIDAMFADAELFFNMADMLDRQKRDMKIWLLCSQEAAVPEDTAGCHGVLSWPVTEHKMRYALECMM